jgi:hypothetical protein
MPHKSLPPNPNLQHLRRQARDLQKSFLARDPRSLHRVSEFHTGYKSVVPFSLADAQFTLAREYCFPKWASLKAYVEAGEPVDSSLSYRDRILDLDFKSAVQFIDEGRWRELEIHLSAHPQIVRQRVFFSFNRYFGNPSLLEFTAENPVRVGKMAPEILQVASAILKAGAKSDQRAIDSTLELIASGRVARECGFQPQLLDLLSSYGADVDAAMPACLLHGEFDAAENLIRNGAKVDLCVAVATGREQKFEALLPQASPLERRQALALAAQFGQFRMLQALFDAGVDAQGFNPIGFHSHSTPLHQAALGGRLQTVKVLVGAGADLDARDILYSSTPAQWAAHGGQGEVAEFLQSQTKSPEV